MSKENDHHPLKVWVRVSRNKWSLYCWAKSFQFDIESWHEWGLNTRPTIYRTEAVLTYLAVNEMIYYSHYLQDQNHLTMKHTNHDRSTAVSRSERHLQLACYFLLTIFTIYLRLTLVFMWSRALRKKFNFSFSRVDNFDRINKMFILTGRLGTRLSLYKVYMLSWYFLIS